MSIRNADLVWTRPRLGSRAAAMVRPIVRVRPLSRPVALWQRRRAVRLLVVRDLKVRYASSALGYIWSVLEPLLLGLTYWFIFTKIFHRPLVHGDNPYIIFLLAGIFPWTWFSTAVGDTAKALRNESKLVRSTNVPRELWVLRVVISKGIEFAFSLPVLLIFALLYRTTIYWQIAYLIPAALLMAILCMGVGLLLSPLVVLLDDLDRIVRLVLRLGFYASPIVYMVQQVPAAFKPFFGSNPLNGILELCRAGFFPWQLSWADVRHSAIISLCVLLVGWLVFIRLERTVLKEI